MGRMMHARWVGWLALLAVAGVALAGCGGDGGGGGVPGPVRDLAGRVVDVLGQPVAGAQVRVEGFGNATMTNASGDFVLQDVTTNPVVLLITSGGSTQRVNVGAGILNLGTIAFIPSTQGPPPPPNF